MGLAQGARAVQCPSRPMHSAPARAHNVSRRARAESGQGTGVGVARSMVGAPSVRYVIGAHQVWLKCLGVQRLFECAALRLRMRVGVAIVGVAPRLQRLPLVVRALIAPREPSLLPPRTAVVAPKGARRCVAATEPCEAVAWVLLLLALVAWSIREAPRPRQARSRETRRARSRRPVQVQPAPPQPAQPAPV